MEARVRERALEPFFTTHEEGRGLGLAVVAGVATAHQAVIDIDSTPGHGTTVTVRFPVMDEPSSLRPGLSDVSAGDERLVLIVDDEPSLRNLLSRTLNSQGIQTLTAGDGEDALQVLSHQPEIDLVLLDLTMPKKDGFEVFSTLRAQGNTIPIVLMSGYSEHALKRFTAINGETPPFLQKPFRAHELVDVIQKILAAPP
jgi:two-component system, cell cycle sensor histidine kinase and response regulator CckA